MPITTVEGLLDNDKLGPVQQAFAEEDAFQCGFCTPGQIMAVEGLLRSNPESDARSDPDRRQREPLSMRCLQEHLQCCRQSG